MYLSYYIYQTCVCFDHEIFAYFSLVVIFDNIISHYYNMDFLLTSIFVYMIIGRYSGILI